MKKLLKILFIVIFIAIPIWLLVILKTGILCATYIQFSLDGLVRENPQLPIYSVIDSSKERELEELLAPKVCSKKQVETVFSDYSQHLWEEKMKSLFKKHEELSKPK